MDEKTIARFWSKVDKSGPVPPHVPELGPCWEWSGVVGNHGYGQIKYQSGQTAHRFSFELHYGFRPLRCVLHRCDNRRCVRPEHLFEGSLADNVADMIAKGRARHGAAQLWQAKRREWHEAGLRQAMAWERRAVGVRTGGDSPTRQRLAAHADAMGREWREWARSARPKPSEAPSPCPGTRWCYGTK